MEFRGAKRTLQAAIKRVKSEARRELLETLERDPWGCPFRMVRGKGSPPLTPCLQPDLLEGVVGNFSIAVGGAHSTTDGSAYDA